MNREVYPSALFPLRGDVSAEAGAVSVTVQGVQTIPVANTTPTTGQVLQLVGGTWTPQSLPAIVLVNSLGASADYDVAVNQISAVEELACFFNVNKLVSPVPNVSVQVNGFPISDDYSFSVNVVKAVLVNGV